MALKNQMTSSSPAQAFAANLLASFAKAGVTNIFLAPGARSQALAIAAGQLALANKITLHVRLDERSMGFTALGAALASGEPSVLITTSGTAVANLHPAVLEAHHSGVPLILLTADRPEELRGVGANQTTNQVGMFADAVHECIDVAAPTGAASEVNLAAEIASKAIGLAMGYNGNQPGPVQLNLAFREPLSALEPNAAQLDPQIALPEIFDPRPEVAMLTPHLPTVVVAGAGAGEDAVELAEAFGWPLLAEPSSGARHGANAIVGYRHILEKQPELASQIGRVVVFGKPTLSRAVIRLLFNEDIEVVVIRNPVMGHFDVSRRAAHIVDEITVDDEVDFEWLEQWRLADHEIERGSNSTLDRKSLVEAVWGALEPDDKLVLGASRLIRSRFLGSGESHPGLFKPWASRHRWHDCHCHRNHSGFTRRHHPCFDGRPDRAARRRIIGNRPSRRRAEHSAHHRQRWGRHNFHRARNGSNSRRRKF